MSDYWTINTEVIPEVTQIRVYQETIDHIKEEHPELPIELPVMKEALRQALESPTSIEKGKTNATFVYVDGKTTNAAGDSLRVPVKLVEGTSGRVATAFYASREAPPEKVVWRVKDDEQ